MNFDIFYGYQFASDNFQKKELEKLVADTCKIAEKSIFLKQDSKIKISSKCINLNRSKDLLKEITAEIEQSDACIFEISDNNPNVFLEFGYALGLHKPIILLVNKKKAKEIPADIKGLYRIGYEKNKINLLKPQLVNFIKDVFTDILNTSPHYFWQKQISKEEGISIFLGSNKSKSFSSNAIFGVELIRKRIQKFNFKLYCEKEISGLHLKRNIISIGGPLYNHATHTILKLKSKQLKLNFFLEKNKYCIKNRANKKMTYNGVKFSHKYEKPDGFDYGIVSLLRSGDTKYFWIIIAALTGAGTYGLIDSFFSSDKFFSAINSMKMDTQHEFLCEISICNGVSENVQIIEHIIVG